MAYLYRPIQPDDLALPREEFKVLMEEVRSKLYAEDLHWLAEWEYYDKTYVMDDSERAEARRDSYSQWYRRLRESLVGESK